MTEQQILTLIVGPAGALVLYTVAGWLWLKGKIHSHPEFERVERDKEMWKSLYEQERSSHQITRDALLVANERADVAVEQARVGKQVLEAFQQQALQVNYQQPALPASRARKPQHQQ